MLVYLLSADLFFLAWIEGNSCNVNLLLKWKPEPAFFLSVTGIMKLFLGVVLLQSHSLSQCVSPQDSVPQLVAWAPWDMNSDKTIRWVLKILLQATTNKFPLFQSLHIIFFQGQFFFKCLVAQIHAYMQNTY